MWGNKRIKALEKKVATLEAQVQERSDNSWMKETINVVTKEFACPSEIARQTKDTLRKLSTDY